MTPYYIFLFLVMSFAAFSYKYPKNRIVIGLVLLTLVLFAGLRSEDVGTDAAGYARTFAEGRRALEGNWEEQVADEAGYYYLNEFLRGISTEYVVLFLGIAILTYTCVILSIRSETEKLVVPLFVFICLGLYTFVFNAARQGIAVAIYMLSFKYLFQDGYRCFLRYALFVLLAALFHKTAIIALPLYFLFRIKYSIWMLFLIAALGVLMGVFLPTFLQFASTMEERYQLYMTTAGGGEMLTVFYVLITVFFIFWRNKVDDDVRKKYDVFLNMMLFGTLIYLVVQYNNAYVELTRFAAYFQVASVFLWTFIYQSVRRPKALFSVFFVVGHLIFYFIYCSRMANLIPYTLNNNIYLPF